MSIVSAIYKAPVLATAISPQDGEVVVCISYNGKWYDGTAYCHPQEKEFFSERVGTKIAKSRARIKMLADALDETRLIARTKNAMLVELERTTSKTLDEIDPTGLVRHNAASARNKATAIEFALAKEQQSLKEYLKDQDKMIDSVKWYREQQAKDE